MSAIEEAIRIFGTQKAFASRMNVSQTAVIKWRKRRVPAERCRAIEQATEGRITVHDLRPDVFGERPSAAA